MSQVIPIQAAIEPQPDAQCGERTDTCCGACFQPDSDKSSLTAERKRPDDTEGGSCD